MINNIVICDRITTEISHPTDFFKQQIVFIDSQVKDYQILAQGVLPGIEIIILESDRNGIEQITNVLSQKTDLTTIHIVSHGSPGCIYLGDSQLSLDTFNQYQPQLKTWFKVPPLLRENLNLLLYGCNVAAGDGGEKFITKLHQITGAEIAASTTPIGNRNQGANWELDVSTGSDKLELAFSDNAIKSYSGVFVDIFVDNFDGSNPGWIVNPFTNDTATTDSAGLWNIGDPESHDRNTTIAPAQLEANSGTNVLVTGLGTFNAANNDVDGITTVHSPSFALPSNGFSSINLSLNYYHAVTGGATDPLTIELVRASDNTVLSTLLHEDPVVEQDATWTPFSTALNSFAGENVYLRFTASDIGVESILEAGIDDVNVTYEPIIANQISGNVFLDNNFNGLNHSEDGVQNITVTAYDAAGSSVATAQTLADGSYTLTGLNDGTEYRIEFTNLPSGYFSSPIGADSNGSVAFVSSPSSTVNYGVVDPSSIDFTAISSSDIVQNGYAVYSCFGASSSDVVLAVRNLNGIGDVYDLPSNRGDIDSSSNFAQTTTFTRSQFEDNQLHATTISADGSIYVSTSAFYNNLRPGEGRPDPLVPVADAKIYRISPDGSTVELFATLPGNQGTGWMEIDQEHNQIYVSNPDDGQIYVVDTTAAPGSQTAATSYSTFAPHSADALNDADPSTTGAVGFAPLGENILGVGYNKVENRLYYAIWAQDITVNASADNTIRSIGINADGSFDLASDRLEFTTPNENLWGNGNESSNSSMPTLDIEFNEDGTVMLLAELTLDYDFTALRPGHSSRLLEYRGSTTNWTAEPIEKHNIGEVRGVIAPTNGADLDNNARGGVDFAFDTIENGIPNGDDDYLIAAGDALPFDTNTDPDTLIYGFQYQPLTGGDQDSSIKIDGDGVFDNQKGTFADIDIRVVYEGSIEIGNRVWNDPNADGIQDPGEAGISNVTLNLYDETGTTLLGTTTTNTEGEYYFNDSNVNQNGAAGLEPNTSYQIRIDASSPNLSGLTLTTTDTGTKDSIDSDALDTAGTPTILITTGDYGENNYTLDAGFYEPGSISGNVSDDLSNPITNVELQLLDSTGNLVLDSSNQPITTTTGNDGNYLFSNVTPGDYQVLELQPPGYINVSEVEGGADGDNPTGDSTVNNLISVTVDSGVEDIGNDFVEQQAPKDYGDAFDGVNGVISSNNTNSPDYQTTASDNGANHIIDNDLTLGNIIDADDGTQQDVDAIADDNDGIDDEDGVTFTDGTTINSDDSDRIFAVDVVVNNSQTTSTTIRDDFATNTLSGGTGWGSNWFATGQLVNPDSTNERIFLGWSSNSGYLPSISRTFDGAAASGDAILSFDYGRGGLDANDGFEVFISDGFGNSTTVFSLEDATTIPNNVWDPVADPFLASGNLTIPQSLLTSTSRISIVTSGDFTKDDGGNDGAFYFDNFNIEIPTVNTTLVGWLDFDRSGTFDVDEAVSLDSNNGLVTDGTTANTLTWTGFTDDITSDGEFAARFRVSSDTNLDETYPTGNLVDGEVEDYLLTVETTQDYGDAPDDLTGSITATDNFADNSNDYPDYLTREEDGGASHTIKEYRPITIGNDVDGDSGNLQNSNATADDNSDTGSGDDESGVFVTETTTDLNNTEIKVKAGDNYSLDVIIDEPATSATGVASTITGTVYSDYDADGNFDGTQAITHDDHSNTTTTENGLEGIEVKAYDNLGVEVATTTTDANGEYSFSNPTGEPLRIEFSNLPDGYNNTSDTQTFVDGSGNPTVNLGLLADNHYVDSNSSPRLLTTCFVLGGYDQSGEAALVSVLHTNSGADPADKTTEVTLEKVGAVYGLAHSRQTQDIFLGAFQKRHSDVGADGNDAIYRVDSNGNVNTLVELDTYFGTTDIAGAYAHGTISANRTESNRPTDLNIDDSEWFADQAAFAQVTKAGFGDVEISEDGQHLWTINLANRELYKIEVGDGSTYGAQGSESRSIENYDIVNNLTGLEQGSRATLDDVIQDLRPFAIAEKDGLIYVGLIDSAQSTQNASDLHAYVYSFDPAAITPSFTKELDFTLDAARESKANFVNGTSEWSPWVDDFSSLTTRAEGDGTLWIEESQPILSDIEFDNNGDIILGFRDRTADQVGSGSFAPDDLTGSTTYQIASGGDILRGTRTGSNWTIESGAIDSDINTEFYIGEEFNPHQETAQGGLAQIPGYGSIETTALDPLSLSSGGIIGLNNTDGTQTRGIELFVNSPGIGKANGLGDLEYAGEVAPISLGNRLWLDLDRDGIQDAGEAGISGANVNLYDSTGNNLVGTTTTDESGEYYFNESNVTGGLSPNTTYQIQLDHAADFATDGVLDNLSLTVADVNSNADDTLDSDAVEVNGNPRITVTTGEYGENDYTNDFGFIQDITLVAWIDFNRSGTFEPGEAVTLDTDDLNPLVTDGTTPNTLEFTAPANIEYGLTAARFRVASGLTGDNLAPSTATGAAPDGEVEDYIVNLVSPVPPTIDLDGDNDLTGNDFETSFLVGASPVAIADDVLIGDGDDVNLQSAVIKLAIRADGDAAESLVINGALPDGINAVAYDQVTGILELTGEASVADYQIAIAQIEYTNLIGYHTSDRLVEVTVNDGIANSNTATTTIDLDFRPQIDLDGNDSSFV